MGIMNSPINMGGDWSTRGGGQWHAGQRVDPGGWTYSTNYSGNIPEGARTFDPNAPQQPRDPITGEPLTVNPNWTRGGAEYYWLREDGTPAGSTGFSGSNVSNAPWNNQRVRGGGGGAGSPSPARQYGGGGGQQFGFGGGGGGSFTPSAPPQGGGLNMQQIMQQMYGNGGGSQGYGGWGGLQTNKGWR